jgi:hypothetical protein
MQKLVDDTDSATLKSMLEYILAANQSLDARSEITKTMFARIGVAAGAVMVQAN